VEMTSPFAPASTTCAACTLSTHHHCDGHWPRTGTLHPQVKQPTFGPMGPGAPLSPLCPEHLHGTLQHVLSAMLSCSKTHMAQREGVRNLAETQLHNYCKPLGLCNCSYAEHKVGPEAFWGLSALTQPQRQENKVCVGRLGRLHG